MSASVLPSFGVVQCYFKNKNAKRKRVVLDDEGVEGVEGGVSSAKFDFVCNDILAHPKAKSLIFCLWTKEIALLASALSDRGVSVLKFEGSMNRQRRETVLYNFNNTNIQVLIIQINAGGVGLNLQAVQRIYIVSPTWNPCAELQAIARAHRLGQTEVVTCYRLIMEGTIEERIITIQDKKMQVIADCFEDENIFGKMGCMDSLSKNDIMSLFA